MKKGVAYSRIWKERSLLEGVKEAWFTGVEEGCGLLRSKKKKNRRLPRLFLDILLWMSCPFELPEHALPNFLRHALSELPLKIS